MGSFLHKFLHNIRAKSVGRLAFQYYWATRKFALARVLFSGLFQIALGLINFCFGRDRVGVIRNKVQQPIVDF
jgi:hypothetical protein